MHVEDLLSEVDGEYPDSREAQSRIGHRTTLVVPLVKGEEAIGAIALARTRVEAFTSREIALVETFADQAVIAIENARLFSELQERTDDLTRSVERMTAPTASGRR